MSCLYRQPDSKISNSIDTIEKIYANVKNHLYLCGDFNVNLLNYHHHNGTTDFIDSLVSLNLFPCITKPTCITRHSSTIIDNIHTNNIFHTNKSGLLMNDIIDHLPIFTFSLHEVKRNESKIFIYKRKKDEQSIKMSNNKLRPENWNSVVSVDDVNIAYDNF